MNASPTQLSPYSTSTIFIPVRQCWFEGGSAKSKRLNGDDAVVRRSGEASSDEPSTFSDIIIIIIIRRGGADPVRARGQEDEEGEEIQRVVRELEAEEGEDDRANQGQGRGPQVHSLAPSFQAHLTHSSHFSQSLLSL